MGAATTQSERIIEHYDEIATTMCKSDPSGKRLKQWDLGLAGRG